MIDKLFGSKTRVKLLHLFMNHPGQSFYVREITRLIDEQINSVRRELSNMLEGGVITSDTAYKKLYYQVNQRYEFYTALRAIFAGESISSDHASAVATDGINEQEAAIVQSIPGVRLAILAGVLVKGSTASVDIVLVGNISAQKVRAAMLMIEKLEGREINYTVLPYDEFYYRLSVRDKFITEIMAAKHSVVVDTDNVLAAVSPADSSSK
jgi:DNA-binding transcriptional ArsR family regulator